MCDRDGDRPGLDASGLRWVDGTPRTALSVPFLAAICPDAYFVYVHREPGDTVASMAEAWRSGGYVSCPDLPGWSGPPWSLPLVPGWRELSGKVLEEIVVEQWIAITSVLLDDLESLAPERWCVADLSALLDDPRHEVERVCAFVEIEAGEDVTLPIRALRDEPAMHEAGAENGSLATLLRRTMTERGAGARAAGQACEARQAGSGARRFSPAQRLHAELPAAAPRALGSLLVSTYQTGKLICARHDHGTAQHPLPRLRATDGPRSGARTDRDRHPGRGARLPRLPRGRVDPFTVRFRVGERILQLLVVDDAAFFEVD